MGSTTTHHRREENGERGMGMRHHRGEELLLSWSGNARKPGYVAMIPVPGGDEERAGGFFGTMHEMRRWRCTRAR